jgi:hypothetical protein
MPCTCWVLQNHANLHIMLCSAAGEASSLHALGSKWIAITKHGS